MSVRNEVVVNYEACVGCGVCIEVCPPDVLRVSAAGKAYPAYAQDCQGCFLCVLNCSFEAVEVKVHLDPDARATLRALQETASPTVVAEE